MKENAVGRLEHRLRGAASVCAATLTRNGALPRNRMRRPFRFFRPQTGRVSGTCQQSCESPPVIII